MISEEWRLIQLLPASSEDEETLNASSSSFGDTIVVGY
jgi:hypothetical protein